MINKRQPRTLGEVQMQAQNANQVFSLDAVMWTTSLSEVFTQQLELCQQYMPERVFALVTGQDDLEPIHMTRDEIQGKYHIVCRGNDTNTNPYVKAQKSQMRVQLMLGDESSKAMGVITPPNVYNIWKRYLQDDGEIAWKGMITMPQPPQEPQLPPVGTIVVPTFADLGEGEQSQVLSSIGIKPDGEGRMLEKAQELHEQGQEEIMNTHQRKMDIEKLKLEERNAQRKLEEAKAKAKAKPNPTGKSK